MEETGSDALPFFPTFFLVGAPRCGTTSIAKHLGRHPEICFSWPKEPHYFNRVSPEELGDIRSAYLERCFPHYDPAKHKAIGEGSVSTLYHPEAVRLILKLDADARFVVAVRNPVEMLRSYHFRLLYVLEEDEEDFATAWGLQEARQRGERIPKRCMDPRMLQYAEVGKFAEHIEALQALAGPEQVHVVMADDLASDPRRVYRDLFAFLGVGDDGRTEFPRRMKSKTYRYRWLHRALYKPPRSVLKAVEKREARVRRKGGDSRLRRLRKRLLHMNRVERKPPPLSDAMRDVLREAFADDTRRLGELLGRDLSHWR